VDVPADEGPWNEEMRNREFCRKEIGEAVTQSMPKRCRRRRRRRRRRTTTTTTTTTR
jgi:hypothetical protein